MRPVARTLGLVVAALCIAGPWAAPAGPGPGEAPDCAAFGGILQSRCERQALMDAKCGNLAGVARTACERGHFIANPLVCPVSADDECPCHLERYVVEVCRDATGAAFEACLRRHGDFGVLWHAPSGAFQSARATTR